MAVSAYVDGHDARVDANFPRVILHLFEHLGFIFGNCHFNSGQNYRTFNWLFLGIESLGPQAFLARRYLAARYTKILSLTRQAAVL